MWLAAFSFEKRIITAAFLHAFPGWTTHVASGSA
jgi:hypothetical protein